MSSKSFHFYIKAAQNRLIEYAFASALMFAVKKMAPVTVVPKLPIKIRIFRILQMRRRIIFRNSPDEGFLNQNLMTKKTPKNLQKIKKCFYTFGGFFGKAWENELFLRFFSLQNVFRFRY